MFFDVAMMMTARCKFAGPDMVCYAMADSSPQFGKDWLLTEMSLLSRGDAVQFSKERVT